MLETCWAVYDHAIQTRAEMRLKAEEAEQEEAATDLKLAKKLERAEKERELQVQAQDSVLVADGRCSSRRQTTG